MKEIKKIGLLGIASLSLLLPSIVKAEKVCITHKNYYFFTEIYRGSTEKNADGSFKDNTNDNFLNTINSLSPTDKHSTNRKTYFPTVPTNAEASEGNSQIKRGRICLAKTETSTPDGPETECNGNTMTLEEYYDLRAKLIGKGEEKSLKIGNETTTYTVYEEKGDNVVNDYFWHGRWFKLNDDNDVIAEGGAGVDINSIEISKLVDGTFLPENTNIDFNLFKTGEVNIKRDIYKKDVFKDDGTPLVTPFKVAWKASEEAKNSLLAPALYYIEYNICEDKYNATINYYYYKDGKTEDRVKNDDGNEVPAHTEKELAPGYTNPVNSPKISGCTIVDENGKPYDEDKVVKITIDKTNPKDFNKNVYYYCKVEEEPTTNGKTGDALIYIAWAIGIGALGYSAYYFMNSNKEKKEEI